MHLDVCELKKNKYIHTMSKRNIELCVYED